MDPYPTFTFGGNPLSSFRILLVTPRGRRQFSATLLYRQLSWRLNSGFELFIILTLTGYAANARVLLRRCRFRRGRPANPSLGSSCYLEYSPPFLLQR